MAPAPRTVAHATSGNPIETRRPYPLVVEDVAVPGCAGRIGMTFVARGSDGPPSHRGLDGARADLEILLRAAPALVIALNEPAEFATLGIPDFKARLVRSGLAWRHLPIPEATIPGAAFESAWRAEARAALRAGELVVLHCRSGLGRTGTVAARLLVECGASSDGAIDAVRRVRPSAIVTRAQEAYVRAIRPLDAHARGGSR